MHEPRVLRPQCAESCGGGAAGGRAGDGGGGRGAGVAWDLGAAVTVLDEEEELGFRVGYQVIYNGNMTTGIGSMMDGKR